MRLIYRKETHRWLSEPNHLFLFTYRLPRGNYLVELISWPTDWCENIKLYLKLKLKLEKCCVVIWTFSLITLNTRIQSGVNVLKIRKSYFQPQFFPVCMLRTEPTALCMLSMHSIPSLNQEF